MTAPFQLKSQDWIDEPDGKREFNAALFAEVAGKYQFVTRALSLGRDAAWKRKLIAGMPDLSQPACLDLACGPGDITLQVADRYPDGEVTGLDLCEEMLALARQRTAPANVTFLQGDMCDLPFEDGTFDLVSGGYALRNAPSLRTALLEIHRVLRPGGHAAFLDFSKPPQRALQRAEHAVLMGWGGFWGWALHRNPEVYAYIAKSLQQFPDRQRLAEMLTEQGFHEIRAQRFYLGVIEVLRFRKPEAL